MKSASDYFWRSSKLFAKLIVVQSTCIQICTASIFVIKTSSNMTQNYMTDMPASFGPELPTFGLQGFVVNARPKNGCLPIDPPPSVANFTGNWVALIERSTCSYMSKVLNAQISRYDAVIIYNFDSNELEPMPPDGEHDEKSVIIPSVFVGFTDGKTLENYYTYDKGFYVDITPSLPFNIEGYILPFAITIGLCFVIMLGFMAVKCVRDYRRTRRYRLSRSALKKLPLHKFKKGDPYDCCAVCLEDYVDNDKLRILPCAHAYHSKCIDPWLTRNRRVCPVCKRVVLAEGERQSDIETETEDENAPLINTEGGTHSSTFAPQSENPFQVAERQAQQQQQQQQQQPPPRRSRSSRSRSSRSRRNQRSEGYQTLAASSSESSIASTNGNSSSSSDSDDVSGEHINEHVTQSGQQAETNQLEDSRSISSNYSDAAAGPVEIAVDIINTPSRREEHSNIVDIEENDSQSQTSAYVV